MYDASKQEKEKYNKNVRIMVMYAYKREDWPAAAANEWGKNEGPCTPTCRCCSVGDAFIPSLFDNTSRNTQPVAAIRLFAGMFVLCLFNSGGSQCRRDSRHSLFCDGVKKVGKNYSTGSISVCYEILFRICNRKCN